MAAPENPGLSLIASLPFRLLFRYLERKMLAEPYFFGAAFFGEQGSLIITCAPEERCLARPCPTRLDYSRVWVGVIPLFVCQRQTNTSFAKQMLVP